MEWLDFSMGIILGCAIGMGVVGVWSYRTVIDLRIENAKLEIDLLHVGKCKHITDQEVT